MCHLIAWILCAGDGCVPVTMEVIGYHMDETKEPETEILTHRDPGGHFLIDHLRVRNGSS